MPSCRHYRTEARQIALFAASRQKGMWMGGTPPLGYDTKDKKLYIVPKEAETVRFIFQEYLASTSTLDLVKKLKDKGIKTKSWTSAKSGKRREGKPFNKGMLERAFPNLLYGNIAIDFKRHFLLSFAGNSPFMPCNLSQYLSRFWHVGISLSFYSLRS